MTAPSALFGLVAEEFGRTDLVGNGEPDVCRRGFARTGPALARLGALARHGVLETAEIDMNAARAQRILGQVEREPEGVVELEGSDAVEHVARLEVRRLLFKNGQTASERLEKALFLEPHRFGNHGLAGNEFRIGLAHLRHQGRHQTWITGSLVPRSVAWRMARRMMRLST